MYTYVYVLQQSNRKKNTTSQYHTINEPNTVHKDFDRDPATQPNNYTTHHQ